MEIGVCQTIPLLKLPSSQKPFKLHSNYNVNPAPNSGVTQIFENSQYPELLYFINKLDCKLYRICMMMTVFSGLL